MPEILSLHSRRVEKFDGDYYGVCDCGARSLPVPEYRLARGWVCPREEAEVEVQRNAEAWARRSRVLGGLHAGV